MAEIRVGKPDVAPDATAHVKGVAQGNATGSYRWQVGHHADGSADARRSTGVRPKRRNPVAPRSMPNLPPG
ncbi:hypothetical protein CcI156_19245 [Frankia sp. CcI156]|jgi:hypothetical protein|uniref:hypothetical protein n=1 Tax=Frankia TaxID=1854 RepID=UPI0002D8CC9D|nr:MULTISPECIES: hypothetical protein [Frankia]ETA00642.1 hypothetical protein CcI6DRAFT_03961 [Frankia sp. CcI6]EYT90752.1 hypothetical protein ThrDRAFT_03594 [Frankia casuarinae]KDA41598.1 hypothetical protein BMG523Draft_03600 [Frankia sp. BMG5.23]KEZ35090.1 hypothetical protein CEDDRAFT_03574 [Frankia sp. CeD]KFB03129.1 hypothetical protein ALLO2DRAFT_04098 [Frankia sp. Allo2]